MNRRMFFSAVSAAVVGSKLPTPAYPAPFAPVPLEARHYVQPPIEVTLHLDGKALADILVTEMTETSKGGKTVRQLQRLISSP